MNRRSMLLVVLAMLVGATFPLHVFAANKKPVTPSQQWQGSVADVSLIKAAPEFIVTEKGLEHLWKTWNVPGPLPQVDFSRSLVVVRTTQGSLLRLSATLDESGNLQVAGLASMDFRPGFRYVIAVFSRKGVKTVNGKELGGSG